MGTPRPEDAEREATLRGSRVGISTKVISVAIAAIIVIATGLFLLLPYWAAPAGNPASSSASRDGLLITSNASSFFLRGYYSHEVNFSLTHSGEVIVLGNVSFFYVIPSNLETRTMTATTGRNATTTVAVVTAEYQCGISLGQRRFFFAQFGSSSATVRLDYCAVLNEALNQQNPRGSTDGWALWQVSRDSTPPVALYMAGHGESVNHTALWVGK